MTIAQRKPALLLLGLLGLIGLTTVGASARPPADQEEVTAAVYLPAAIKSDVSPGDGPCQSSATPQYSAGTAFQFDLDNPVRPAHLHADKNIELRGYILNEDGDLQRELVDYGSDDPTQPPQLATLFNPPRVDLSNFYRMHEWNWAPSPDPGSRGAPKAQPPVTALGLATAAGEPIHVPSSGYDIGGGMEVLVSFADEDSVTLRYTREDSSGSAGYTVHVDNICTNPELLALYNSLDQPNGPRYVYMPPSQRPYGYNLPDLPAGKLIGRARGDELVVAIVDSGAFMDPRSCNEWWQIRPGYAGSCPPANWWRISEQ